MSMSSQTRPTASLPQSSSSQVVREPHKAPFYVPTPRQLEPGPKNPLILCIRSCIPEEVDYALPRLVVASYDQPDRFQLERFTNAVPALLQYPILWLEDLERGAAAQAARREGRFGELGEWKVDPATEERAINSLLVLRNACFAGSAENPKFLSKSKGFISFVTRLFSLPTEYLLDEVLLGSPETVQHVLVTLQCLMPYLKPTPAILDLYSSALPTILIHTRDLTILSLVLPLLISALLIPILPPLPAELTPHLLLLLSLTPPPTILDLTLDLLISLTLQPGPARLVLASPNISAHLRHLMRLLEYGSRQTSASFEAPAWTHGGMARNPASSAWASEEASRKRGIEREEAQRRIEVYGPDAVMSDVGERAPSLSEPIRIKLFKMQEPGRSIAWMHESFVYSSMSQLPQVAFWHSYREFFTNSQVTEQLLTASEVIKNVTTAFPGAAAKVWVDETGTQRFVIAGIGFRKSLDETEKYTCRWKSCSTPSGSSNPTQLLSHLHSAHLFASTPSSCSWAGCTHSPCTTSHLLTHLPLPRQRSVPDKVLSNPNSSAWLSSPNITRRAPPLLPPSYKLHFTAFSTPTDPQTRHPMGVAFLSALLIRNLAKVLKGEIGSARPGAGAAVDESGMTAAQKRKKAERFGLPIPDNIVKEEEEEERLAQGQDNDLSGGRLNWVEVDRARMAFEGLEERLGEVVAVNLSGLGQYLGEAWGW